MSNKRIAIIGGGITGLSAAYYLQKEIEEKGLQADFTLYEANEKLGGKIDTDYTDGFVIEQGPDSVLARKTSVMELAKEVGMTDEDVVYSKTGSYILHEGKLYPMPGGAIFGIPTQWGPFLKTQLLSPVGKARAGFDLVLPRTSNGDEDQSLGNFFRKRLGNEVVERLIEPLLSGVYAGNIDQLSLKATFPQFQQIEKKYRSLIVGMKTSMAKGPTQAKKAPSSEKKSAKPRGMFLNFRNGLQSLVDQVERQLDPMTVKKGTALKSLEKLDSQYRLTFADGSEDIVDHVVITTPHHITYKFLKGYDFAQWLNEIPSTSVATVAMAFPKEAVKQDMDGSGFVVSKKTNYSITACTWTHKKWEHSTPEGKVLLRGYVGRAGDDDIVFKSDEEILSAVMKDLSHIMELEGDPDFYRIRRWKHSMPQYIVGHKERLQQFKSGLEKNLPKVHVTGSSFEGIGVPDCIDQGKKVVETLSQKL
ncbi:protoporphyrinogen oxidase [Bacillus shivajii]|uniref:protoporphyrinogen oxidase n=1 Tax=Bacillus shivajii TaxID=1983719 RepID=UPI001CFB2BCF|nr:protoporphyrinogen oxidase [Bacillus shivajii]UCZ54336.1 protoporphyrinogen oxidase [Bacillus shivajii]